MSEQTRPSGKIIGTATSPGTHANYTKANTDFSGGPCRALVCGTAGTANLMDASGTILTNFPLQAGYNPISVLQVRTGGTADNIWIMY